MLVSRVIYTDITPLRSSLTRSGIKQASLSRCTGELQGCGRCTDKYFSFIRVPDEPQSPENPWVIRDAWSKPFPKDPVAMINFTILDGMHAIWCHLLANRAVLDNRYFWTRLGWDNAGPVWPGELSRLSSVSIPVEVSLSVRNGTIWSNMWGIMHLSWDFYRAGALEHHTKGRNVPGWG